MSRPIFPAALLAACVALPLFAQQPASSPDAPQLTMEQQTALRCGVAFAIVAQAQKAGDPAAANYPPLGERGREFFVRTTARMMDEAGAGRETVSLLVNREFKTLNGDQAMVRQIMPACLLMLEASGL